MSYFEQLSCSQNQTLRCLELQRSCPLCSSCYPPFVLALGFCLTAHRPLVWVTSTQNWPHPLLGTGGFRKATARGFEPLRAEPNGFRVHLFSRSDTLSLRMANRRRAMCCCQIRARGRPSPWRLDVCACLIGARPWAARIMGAGQ